MESVCSAHPTRLDERMRECWASCLGDCDGGISAEHIVSQSLFQSKTVNVRGFHWCKDHSKTISLASLTKNALCRHHNAVLSPVDSAGSHAFDVFRTATRLNNERMLAPHQRHKRVNHIVNARDLERWLLKTLINIGYGGDSYIGPNSSQRGLASADLVEIAFGRRQFKPENGMFVAAKPGQYMDSQDHLHCSLLMKDAYICGARFVFRGLRMFLDLIPGGMRQPFESIPGMEPDWCDVRPMKPFKRMKFERGGRLDQTITFRWTRKRGRIH